MDRITRIDGLDGSFLGTGWSFPPAFDLRTGSVVLVSDAEDIRQSLRILFATRPGERLMRPEYGCDLETLVFDHLSAAIENRMVDLVTRAVAQFEPRIGIERVTIDVADPNQGRLDLRLDYTILLTNTKDNLVYPFYYREGRG